MQTFMVERYRPSVGSETFADAVRRAAEAAAVMTEQGVPVRHLVSVFVPDDECSFCWFEAHDAEAVREVNRRAGASFSRVVEAVFVER